MRAWLIASLLIATCPVLAHAEIAEQLVGWWKMTLCNGWGINECPVAQNVLLRADGTFRLSTDWGENDGGGGEIVETGEWTTVPCEDLVQSEPCVEYWDVAIVLGELQPKEGGWTGAMLVGVDGQTLRTVDDVATDGLLKVWSYLGSVSSETASWSTLKSSFR